MVLLKTFFYLIGIYYYLDVIFIDKYANNLPVPESYLV